MIRKVAFSMLCIAPMSLFALRGCAATLLKEAPGEQAALAQQALATARADEAQQHAAQRNQSLPAGGQHFRGGVDVARPAETETAEKGVPDAVAVRARYDETEQAEQEQAVAGAEIDRPALRRKVAAAFEARQDMLRRELAEFRSRLDRLLRTFEDRERNREMIIDRRVDELLNPNLRWDEQAPPASSASKDKPVADIERIQGTWQVIIQEIDGKLTDLGPQPLLWTFQGSEIFSAQGQPSGRFRLDATRKPAELTIEGDNLNIKAIYQFEGDTLTVAMFGKPEQQRPRSFAAADAGGDGLPLVVRKLRRIAKMQYLPYPMAPAPLSTSPIDPSVNAERNPRPLILIGHSDWVTGVAFSPNGKLVASSSRDKTIKIWDAAAGRELFTLKRGRSDSNNGHAGYVAAVAFSPDGKRVASAGAGDNLLFVRLAHFLRLAASS